MSSIITSLHNDIPTKRDEKNLLVEFVRYMLIGVNRKQIQNKLHISSSELTNIEAGKEPYLSKYNQIIRYAKNNE